MVPIGGRASAPCMFREVRQQQLVGLGVFYMCQRFVLGMRHTVLRTFLLVVWVVCISQDVCQDDSMTCVSLQ